jgi:hypothetical protein
VSAAVETPPARSRVKINRLRAARCMALPDSNFSAPAYCRIRWRYRRGPALSYIKFGVEPIRTGVDKCEGA